MMVWCCALNRKQLLLVVGAMVFIAMAGLSGCGNQQADLENDPAKLSVGQIAQADRTFAQLRQEASLRRNRKVLDLAGALLDHYAPYERNDEVLDLAVTASANLGEAQQALAFAEELFIKYPESPLVGPNLLKSANMAIATGDSLAAAGYMVRHFDFNPTRDTLADGSYLCDPYLNGLTAKELGLLMSNNRGAGLWSYLGYLRVKKLMAEDHFFSAEQVVTELQAGASLSPWTAASSKLLYGKEEEDASTATGNIVLRPEQIGVLCPLTGRFAVYGNAFFDAALLAQDQVNMDTGRSFKLLVEDTSNDPVTAAIMARKLCVDEGCIALLGALRSSPTSCAALVADQNGVPIVSPTAENHHLWELGSVVFQTNLTDLYEIRLLAQLTNTVLLKKRYAILYPRDEKGRGANQANLFQAEVEKYGGEVVAVEGYSVGSSDFRQAILNIRKKRPEVIFAPATVDQMAQLAPQLDFNHTGSIVLGLSNLNSESLIKRAGAVLERTIFPSDVAVFPGHWVNDFQAQWNKDNYEAGVTKLAKQVYLASRLLLETLHDSGATSANQLSDALGRRLAVHSIDGTGPDLFHGLLRTVREGSNIDFDADLYVDGWELTEGAAALLEAELEAGLENGTESDGSVLDTTDDQESMVTPGQGQSKGF